MGLAPKQQKQEGLKAILELHKAEKELLGEQQDGKLKVGFLDKVWIGIMIDDYIYYYIYIIIEAELLLVGEWVGVGVLKLINICCQD